jgi:REP element-mobilizing transposase RayT
MSRPLRIEYPGATYHITARGNERADIFRDNNDRQKLLEQLQIALQRYAIVIHAYVLMGNHYHLLLETPEGNMSQAMHFINGNYTGYFNHRHRRVGHLFQGRYKGLLVEKESYLLSLSRYIHLNPVRAGIVEYPEEYHWSNR